MQSQSRRRSKALQQQSAAEESEQAAASGALQDNQQQHLAQLGRASAGAQGAWEHLPTQAQLVAAGRYDLLYSLRQHGYEATLKELSAQGMQLGRRYKKPKQKVGPCA